LQHSNFYTFRFIGTITIVASLLLSLAATQLKDRQEFNIEVDKKKNILKCIGLDVSVLSAIEIQSEYKKRIKDIVLLPSGEKSEGISSDDLIITENKSTGQMKYYADNSEYLPAYLASDPEAFIIPISGKGLWSTLYGYLALENDLNTVKGITFYKHGETPGLGGEVEKEWFQGNFVGKKIYNDLGDLVSIKVVKGKAREVLSGNALNHSVDGISGATVTSRGVTTFLKDCLMRYQSYIERPQN